MKRGFLEAEEKFMEKAHTVVGKQIRYSPPILEDVVEEDAEAWQQILEYQAQEQHDEDELIEALEGQEYMEFEEEDDDQLVHFPEEAQEDWENLATDGDGLPVDREMLEEFEKYCNDKQQNTCDLTVETKAAVELMTMLSSRRVPLLMYEEIFAWHLNNIGATTSVPRKGLMKTLRDRYNQNNNRPKIHKSIVLPYSKSKVKLVVHDAKAQILSLLTDPRLNDEDYLFINDDPFAPPPEDFSVLGDVNTGKAYRETYKQLIKDPSKEVLMPVILYIDSAVTGQFDSLPMEAMKFTLGIFNRKSRDKHYFWKKIGYMTTYQPEKSNGQVMLEESKNIDAKSYLSDDSDGEDDADAMSINTEDSNHAVVAGVTGTDDNDVVDPTKKSCSQQDYHAMLDVMFESYRELEALGGIEWNLRYKGKLHHVVFKPFILFVKGDTQEHDKLCGKYLSRAKGVKHLCRYCMCPNEETDNPFANHDPKTKTMIQSLVQSADLHGLQQISQQYIDNAMYKLKFGRHNDTGIHGASPLEILHWIQLGLFQQIVQMFFTQTGPSSVLTDKICAFAKAVGSMLGRQSDRDYPNTEFSKGIRTGRLQAHEMTGLMLVLVATLRSSHGRQIMKDNCRGDDQNLAFGTKEAISEWIILLESMLQMEAWLKLPELQVFDVLRYKARVGKILELYKIIGQREEGMGFKTFKFHGTLHVADDILNFGVPMNVHTGSNEMHHKPDKNAALKTQRRPKLFDYQFAKQCHNQDTIQFAIEEIHENRVPWTYFYNLEDAPSPVAQIGAPFTTGTSVTFYKDASLNKYVYSVNSRMKHIHRFKLDKCLVEFLAILMEGKMKGHINHLSIRTEHKRDGEIFRASPHFNNKAWRDWAMIKWDGYDELLPAQIWCYLDFTCLTQHDSPYPPGMYAVVESTLRNKQIAERGMGDLFQPFLKEMDGKKRKFYVCSVDSFEQPACVIPDIGNKQSDAAYLRLLPRSEWCDTFQRFLASEDALID